MRHPADYRTRLEDRTFGLAVIGAAYVWPPLAGDFANG